MTEIERTSAGLQTVIPGCERRTLPRSTTRVDENGQGLLHFYKPSSLREQLTRQADAPLPPRRGQRAMPTSGLFGSKWPDVAGAEITARPRPAFRPGTIGRTDPLDPPPNRPVRRSNIDHPKIFWSSYGYRGIFS